MVATLSALVICKPEEAAHRILLATDKAEGDMKFVAKILGVTAPILQNAIETLHLQKDICELIVKRGFTTGGNQRSKAGRAYVNDSATLNSKRFRMPVRFDEFDPDLADEAEFDR
jgi:hypothetical protein